MRTSNGGGAFIGIAKSAALAEPARSASAVSVAVEVGLKLVRAANVRSEPSIASRIFGTV